MALAISFISVGLHAISAEPKRIAVVAPEGCHQIPASIAGRVVEFTVSPELNSGVVLLPMSDPNFDLTDHRLMGACGNWVTLPPELFEWKDASVFRGVASGSWRPNAIGREHSLEGMNRVETALFNQSRPSVDWIPSDVVLFASDERLLLGCDWNCDLVISDSELQVLKSETSPSVTLVNFGQESLLINLSRYEAADQLVVNFMPVGGSSESTLDATWQQLSATDQTEFVVSFGSHSPSKLCDAVNRASELSCDLMIVDLAENDFQGMQLLAQLSSRLEVKILLTSASLYAPDFWIAKDRRAANALEATLWQRGNATNFETQLSRVLAGSLRSDRIGQDRESNGDDDLATTLDALRSELGAGKCLSCSSGTAYVARIPPNVTGGTVWVNGGESIDVLNCAQATFFDSTGAALSRGHFEQGQLFLSHRCTGGFVVFDGLELTSQQIEWQTHPELHTEQQQGDETALLSVSERTSKTERRERLRGEKLLHQVPLKLSSEQDVPKHLLQANRTNANESSQCRSWWYRVAPIPLDVQLTIDQRLGDTEVSFAPDGIRFYAFSESGWSDMNPYRLGEVVHAYPRVDWIQVQYVCDDAQVQLNAPRLVSSFRLAETSKRTWSAAENNAVYTSELLPSDSAVPDIVWERLTDWKTGELIGILENERSGIQAERDWLWHYDNDPIAAEIESVLQTGLSPSHILAQSPWVESDSASIVSMRRRLLALDQPSLRKQNLEAIIRLCDAVVETSAQQLGHSGVQKDGATVIGYPVLESYDFEKIDSENSKYQITQAWIADAAYRRVRAIGYRELPDVVAKHPIVDQQAQDAAYEKAYHWLAEIVPINDSRFVLTKVRFKRRRGNAESAYDVLRDHGYEGPAIAWYFKKERDLWSEAGDEALRRLGHARWFLRQAQLPVQF
ncbi:hypothetical protein ACMFWY_22720 [Roseiconus sp. JC912]|uniref:hypothetical protein n=1 Tax=Roseiconus sp. JC912 TaxID=3396307 RepID=UPI003A4C7848